jgi:hypothetical protein
MEILFVFTMCHLFGDYVLQSNFIANTKANNKYHLFVHCALYTLSFYLGMLLLNGVVCCILPLIFITHAIIDYWKCYVGHDRKSYIVDQVLHYAIVMFVTFIYYRLMYI